MLSGRRRARRLPEADGNLGITALFGRVRRLALRALGGPARLQVVIVMGAVLGLDAADKGAVAAVSDQLKPAFGIGNTEIGLLLAVVSFVGAVGTLPMGVLADRVPRRIILMASVGAWAAAMVVSGLAASYLWLLTARVALGAVTAAAWPCIASLTGDFFPARERASMFGLILSGELIGAGIGFFVAGEVSTLLGWRWAFHAMALPSLALIWVIRRHLPEPMRGAQSVLRPGERDPASAARPRTRKRTRKRKGENAGGADLNQVQEAVREDAVEPRRALVIAQDPTGWGGWRTMRYLLRLPSYRLG